MDSRPLQREVTDGLLSYGITAPSFVSDTHLLPLAVFLERVRVLIEAKLFPEAEVIIKEGILLHSQDLETSASLAVVAAGQDHWPEAALRWTAVLEQFPSVRVFDGAAATAFAKAGLVTQADALLERNFIAGEEVIGLRELYALIASQTERRSLAAARWGELVELKPGNVMYVQLKSDALWQADVVDDDTEERRLERLRVRDSSCLSAHSLKTAPDATSPVEGVTDRGDVSALLGGFESLGDNCEFGLLQRHFGYEPATLYRFSAIVPERMVELLNLGLAPLGDPEHTIVEISGDEYMVHDSRGYFIMHTFVPVNQTDAATLLKRQQARITILKRKMLFELERGNRMFVIKDSLEQIPDDLLRRTLASLEQYGSNKLLGVRHAEPNHPAGSIERLDDNILVGYVATMFGCHEEATDYESWLKVLRAASALKEVAIQ